MATEASFEADHCDFMDSHSCKSHKDEPEELGDNDDKSSTNEGSFVPHACGTEASEDASELAEWFDSLAPSSVAGNSASYSRSFLLSVNANLRRQMQQTSVPPLDSLTLPKMLPVRVKCPSRSIESSETKAILQGHRSSGSPTEAASRRVRQGIMCEQTEPSMIVDSSKQSTIMLRNIPNRCNRASITQQLEAHGFGGAYDLVYVPIDKTVGNLNLGYAFVNFREEEDCSRFREAFNGKRAKVLFPNSCSDKVLIIAPASVQGRDAYLKRLSSFVWPAGSDNWQPLIFDDNGQRIRLPVGRPDAKNFETAVACKASPNSSLCAEAPEFVPAAASPASVETDCDVGGVLDHLLTPPCDAPFRGAPGLELPVLDPMSVQPELHVAALAKATQYALSRCKEAASQRSMGLA
eukprot:CAMPEP_0172781586 /NCGR_PEP_ID=MMETSP1074-20121228/203505_1 /TAXON_ID=2916 /ORGANISM="Ceratium fusus, Strain PA161109" /LENGTH=407 /DNA_ID=CAMNT_0013618563 /DNA_START=244 /DNA_END=1467 /DNA_ORIENTATION=+